MLRRTSSRCCPGRQKSPFDLCLIDTSSSLEFARLATVGAAATSCRHALLQPDQYTQTEPPMGSTDEVQRWFMADVDTRMQPCDAGWAGTLE
jgi:hypothetical protein